MNKLLAASVSVVALIALLPNARPQSLPSRLPAVSPEQAALIAGDPAIVQTFRLSEAALARLRSSAEDPSQVPGQRQAMEQAVRRVHDASAAIDRINRAASIHLTVNTASGATLDAALQGFPAGSTIANLANQYRNDLSLEANAKLRQWAGASGQSLEIGWDS